MRRIVIVTALLLLTIAQYALALGTPDFSGTWVLDSVSDMGASSGAGNFVKGRVTGVS